LSDDDQRRLHDWIRDLGHAKYSVRSEASRRLVERGTSALPFLKAAESATNAEAARRARLCSEEIRRGPGPALPIAVARRLACSALAPAPALLQKNEQKEEKEKEKEKEHMPAEHSPAETIRALLGYVPFADDETVEDEVINALTTLSVRETGVDPLLPAALSDPLAARRGAAALVLGRVGAKEHVPGVRKLLDDATPAVRFRAAEGLLAAKDPASVPRLIALLSDISGPHLWQIEDRLQNLAGEQSPNVALGDGSTAARVKAVRAWEQWWQANASKIDLTRAGAGDAFLGLVTICEYDSAQGMPAGKVWETARLGPPRWTVTGFLGAMDAQLLPNGNVLVAENSANRVTERDKDGNIKWETKLQGNPVACQRLPNGNTFIASYHQLTEVDAQGKKVYEHSRGAAAYIFGAHKAKNGRIVYMTGQGTIVELEATTGKEIHTLNLGANGGWCGIEALPTGRYLIATMNNNQVREIDAQGKTHWQVNYPGVFRASRMPNGHTLVASMTTKKVAEIDRAGQIRWEKTCEGRPWSVHWR
jgi:outer membrane protein assembly factor BamB